MTAMSPMRCFLGLSLIFSYLLTLCSALYYNSTALVIGRTEDDLVNTFFILDAYGIKFETVMLPEGGGELPPLETDGNGNYGLITVFANVDYSEGTVLKPEQWQTLWNYQVKYNVRMIHLDVYPSEDFGVSNTGICCNDTSSEEQFMQLTEEFNREIPTAGLKITNVTTVHQTHRLAALVPGNSSTTTPILEFMPNERFENRSVGGVINTFPDGREQMAFFIGFGNWSITSQYLGHAYVHWGYRGLYQGFRRLVLGTQIDDMFLKSQMYNTHEFFRVGAYDVEHQRDWKNDLNKRLAAVGNPGSEYFTEFAFNANGNLIYAFDLAQNRTDLNCDSPLFTTLDEPTDVEYKKPLGAGENFWPMPIAFELDADCVFLDPLAVVYANITNRDSFGWVSHTFTHLELNSATYSDTMNEISFNVLYSTRLNLTAGRYFSGSGLVTPAITGLHNGDALRAFTMNGLWSSVGDNTRPKLLDEGHPYWPLITTVEDNGFAGWQITPRFATLIYYDCDTVECNVVEWNKETAGPHAANDTLDQATAEQDLRTIMDEEIGLVVPQLLGLMHDPYMFHQPNLRVEGTLPTQFLQNSTLLNRTEPLEFSMLELWVETMLDGVTRLVDWPVVTWKHDDISRSFRDRMLRDQCGTMIQVNLDDDADITGFVVRTDVEENWCEVPVPVTVPMGVKSGNGMRREQLGNDPETYWVSLVPGKEWVFEFEEPIETTAGNRTRS